ncbi:MAG: ABC transporter permease subunit [Nitrospiraceae bacterium]|nr:ABC transporter permease subunit [Nitrospiraceae bacterium]
MVKKSLKKQSASWQAALLCRVRLVFHYLRLNKMATLSLIMIGGFIVIAVFADVLSPYDPFAIDFSEKLLPSSSHHFFGTDEMGRDLFSRCLLGIRISLTVAAVIIICAASLGVLLGAIAGYVGGWVDSVISRIADVFIAFPPLVLALAITAALGPSLMHAALAIISVWWPWFGRLMRSQILLVKKNTYVEAARAVGASDTRILLQHIFPNCIAPVLVMATMEVGFVILMTATLSFLGMGARPPLPELGALVTNGRFFIREYWWLSILPGVVILALALSFNLLGDALRDILDPRLGNKKM